MRFAYFASRNLKEIIREPVSIILGVLLPVILIVIFSAISKNAPIEVFKSVSIVPGVTIFGFTFITMFLGVLIAKDKGTSFLARLFISPLKAKDYILGYSVSVLPFSIIISVCCLLTGIIIGVPVSLLLLYTFLSFIPYILFSTFFGIVLGIICSETQVMAIGNIFIIASSLLGGAWIDLNILGHKLLILTRILPFSHATKASRIALSGHPESIWPHLLIVIFYAAIFFLLASYLFNKKMKSDNI
jgi:ABC-2 type transport system permease protein